MKKYVLRFWPLYTVTAVVLIAATAFASRAVTTWHENLPITRQHVFVIDAGHGGEDGGAVSCTGVAESSINLQIALRLDALMHFLGHETKMIRTSDVSVYTEGATIAAKKVSDLRNRVRIVNETPNAVLVSIHQNLFAESRYSGAQVFYNAADGASVLAERLQIGFLATVNPSSNRRTKAAHDVYLMENIRCPGVLIECGFLSNPEEEAALRTGEYQKKLCCVIAVNLAGVCA